MPDSRPGRTSRRGLLTHGTQRGQLWENPLYDWGALRRQGWRWWLERFRRTFELVDLARVDHFRGFVACWAVRRGKKTARAGRWRKGLGEALFRAAQREGCLAAGISAAPVGQVVEEPVDPGACHEAPGVRPGARAAGGTARPTRARSRRSSC